VSGPRSNDPRELGPLLGSPPWANWAAESRWGLGEPDEVRRPAVSVPKGDRRPPLVRHHAPTRANDHNWPSAGQRTRRDPVAAWMRAGGAL